jgi:hypothetical protein
MQEPRVLGKQVEVEQFFSARNKPLLFFFFLSHILFLADDEDNGIYDRKRLTPTGSVILQ